MESVEYTIKGTQVHYLSFTSMYILGHCGYQQLKFETHLKHAVHVHTIFTLRIHKNEIIIKYKCMNE